MFKVGITGGIGSGKSMVCQVFKTLGIPVFDADQEAKTLMVTDVQLINSIKELLGSEAFLNGALQRKFISSKVFNNPTLLQSLNALVHPAVLASSKKWIDAQNAPYIIKEAALFFESKSNIEMDFMIGIDAPENLRIQRAMKRDNLQEANIRERMNNQMKEEEKMKLCDIIIINDEQSSILEQVLFIHEILLTKSSFL